MIDAINIIFKILSFTETSERLKKKR